MTIKRAGLADAARRYAEARAIEEARGLAVRRVESTLRRLREITPAAPEGAAVHPAPPVPPAPPAPPKEPRPRATRIVGGRDLDMTQVMPAVGGSEKPTESASPAPAPTEDPADTAAPGVLKIPESTSAADPAAATGATEAAGVTQVTEIAEATEESDAIAPPDEDADQRLRRLLVFVARQEPRVNWAVADRADGTTLLVADLAHGWIPPGIAVPEGVSLLEPERRVGGMSALLGTTTRCATYTPGDSLSWSAEAATNSSLQPRTLPPVEDLGWELGRATHWRDGLPRLVHTVTKAADAGTGLTDGEIDLLQAHLDTAVHQVIGQYPEVVHELLLNCMLLAATAAYVAGDRVAANYHFAWFQRLDTSVN